jgi:hypothetical protein
VAVAHERDGPQIVNALADTLKACTGCHATWKQRVVDDLTWTRLTNAAKAHLPTHN